MLLGLLTLTDSTTTLVLNSYLFFSMFELLVPNESVLYTYYQYVKTLDVI